MTTSPARESATIYQFPPRGRFAASQDANSPADATRAQPMKCVVGNSWYHDEAIREAEQTRKQ